MANDLVKVGCAVLDDYEKWLRERAYDLVWECGDRASTKADEGFKSAYYSGENDVETWFETNGSPTIGIAEAEVIADGEATLFIEFGTGITNPTTAAEGKERAEVTPGMLAHGEYGTKHGASPKGWYYPIEKGLGKNPPPGTELARKKGMENFIHTYGSAAASPMYMAREKIIKDSNKIIKEVFKK
jgi:hypothetical protein